MRAQLGLTPLPHPFVQLDRAHRVLVMTSPAFDFPARVLPRNVRYVGAQLDDPTWAPAWTSPWPAAHPDPLVVVGFSSTYLEQCAVLQRIIDVLGGMPVHGLVTLGPALEPRAYRARLRVPPNVVVYDAVLHARVFPEAAAVFTHAGHGTVVRALAAGVPLLCLPMGRDQHDNAARVVGARGGIAPRADRSGHGTAGRDRAPADRTPLPHARTAPGRNDRGGDPPCACHGGVGAPRIEDGGRALTDPV